MNKNLYKAALAEKGYTQRELAKRLNMAESTLSRKIKNDTFTLKEAEKIIKILEIKNPLNIFFGF